MSAIHDVVGALTQIHKRLREVGKHLAGVVIRGIGGQRFEIVLKLENDLEDFGIVGSACGGI